jgi:hypothetical protein
MWINDFDENGTIEKIITRSVGGNDMPVFLKREMTDQLPFLKKQNLKHREFAKKSIQQLFDAGLIGKATVKQINFAASCIALNLGNGKFAIKNLPATAQFSCVNTIKCTDINRDGKVDIILGGNDFGFQPQFGRLDAGAVTVLLNTGNGGGLRYVDARESGLHLNGVVRDIAEVKGAKNNYLIILQNDSYPELFVSQAKK